MTPLSTFALVLDLLEQQGHRFDTFEQLEAFLDKQAGQMRPRRPGVARASATPSTRRRAA